MQIRNYKLGERKVRIVLLSDIHNKPYEHIISRVRELSADLIAVAGDVTYGRDRYSNVSGFLTACGSIAPTYVSLGNHDSLEVMCELDIGSAVLLDNGYTDIILNGVKLRIGGLSSPASRHAGSENVPFDFDTQEPWLRRFCNSHEYKILLCHQPEFYPRYLKNRPIDLILSGHAHGGQWRIPFTNQGVFAPGQGLFPKLTGGVTDGRLVVSRGLSNTAPFPRFFNPTEIVLIDI